MKKHGWVIEMKKDSTDYPGFYQNDGFLEVLSYSGPLQTSLVCERRSYARRLKRGDEVIRKVELGKNGEAKRIIK
jgi:hypothetical protein